MKTKELFLIGVAIFFLDACSPKQKPEPVHWIETKILEAGKVKISGEKYLLRIGKRKFRLFSPVVFYSRQGRKFYSLDLGEVKGEKIELSANEFVLPKDGVLHLFHGKYSSKEKAQEEIKRLGEGFPVLLWEKQEGGIKVKMGGKWYYGEEVRIYPEAGLLAVDGKRYRGSLILRETAKGIEVVNRVKLEDFLKGCGKSWKNLPSEAAKALAVVLRTRAISSPGVVSAREFGYSGISGEFPQFSEAVKETSGEILVYKQRPVPVPFTLSCGGETDTGGIPYLKRFRCWKREKIVISSEIPHFSPGISIMEALGLLTVEDEDREITPAEAQKWLWSFSRFVSAPKFYPVEEKGKRAFIEALGKTLMEIKPGEETLPLEYLLDASIITEDDLRENSLTQGDAASILYFSLKYLGKPRWKEGKVEIRNGRAFVEGKEIKEPALFRHDKKGLVPASVLLVFEGETVKYLTSPSGEISALLGDGFSGNGEEIVWRKRYSMDSLKERLNYFFPVGEVQDIAVKDRLPSGRVSHLEVEGENDVYLLNEDEIMRFLALPSTWFVIDREYDDDGNIQGFFFIGVGRGKGRGLCLMGARRMALRGINYREILSRYYAMKIKGVESEKGRKRSR